MFSAGTRAVWRDPFNGGPRDVLVRVLSVAELTTGAISVQVRPCQRYAPSFWVPLESLRTEER